ncbi:MAG: HNH endonuclease [Deltaproteobacteria bacterium]|nr:HNH endonuclease [Deltaproteobacteria bacterium]
MRCEQKRWLQVHHIKPVSLGGGNTLENLTTLCSGHHRMRHVEHGLPA